MRIRIAAVGKLKEPHWRAASDEYLKRLRPYATVEVVEVPDRDIGSDPVRAMASEGADLLRAVPDGSRVVLLDVTGPARSSEDLAAWMSDRMLYGPADVTFIVGGSAGFSPEILAASDERMSLSRMTLPHQLARVVLLEQVYRAFRIIRNEPYHL